LKLPLAVGLIATPKLLLCTEPTIVLLVKFRLLVSYDFAIRLGVGDTK
jgi:hypothetical protein